jgi:hypothetical protein
MKTDKKIGSKYVNALVLLLVIGTFVLPSIALAENEKYTLLVPLPCIPTSASTDQNGKVIPGTTCNESYPKSISFENYVQYVFNLVIAVGAALAVLVIVWGGFQYMTSEAPGAKSDGLSKIQNAIYGLLLILCSYIILRTIDPRLVEIPVGLVTPLELKGYDKKITGDFFDQLAKEAGEYKINLQEYTKVRTGLENEKASLKQQKEDAEKDLDYLYLIGFVNGDPEVEQAKVDLAKVNSKILSNTVDIKTSSVKLAMGGEVNQARIDLTGEFSNSSLGNKVERITAAIKNVYTLRDSGVMALRKLGLETEGYKAGGIYDQANSAEMELRVMKLDLAVSSTRFYGDGSAHNYLTGKDADTGVVKEQYQSDIEQLRGRIDNVKDENLKKKLIGQLENSSAVIAKTFEGKK